MISYSRKLTQTLVVALGIELTIPFKTLDTALASRNSMHQIRIYDFVIFPE